MQNIPTDSQISIVEDLDPEPEEKARRSRGIELILGVLLVLGVLIWVGSEWMDVQQKTGEYLAAERAVVHQDWDAARDHYLAAGTYRDSPDRAKEAGQNIDQRNKQYAVALLSTSFGQWATSLQAARAVQQIQPGFRTTDQLIEAAEKQVYQQALSGSLALRTNAQQPGIYYRTASDWAWLPESDRFSEVLGIGTPDYTVYDTPGPHWTPPTSRNMGQARLYGRDLMAASLQNGKISAHELAFDPAVYSFYVWGEKGIWAIRFSFRSTKELHYGSLDSAYAHYMMDYQRWDSPVAGTVDMPEPDWFIMDLGRDGTHILLADMANQGGTESDLYLADADGRNRKLIYAYQGDIESAKFSADGKYVLVTAAGPKGGDPTKEIVEDIVLVKIDGEPSAQLLAEKARIAACAIGECAPTSAVILDRGQLAGKILLADWNPDTNLNVIKLIDTANLNNPVNTVYVPGIPPIFEEPAWVSQAPDGGSVAISWKPGREDSLIVVVMYPQGRARIEKVKWSDADNTSWKVVRDNYLVSYGLLAPLSIGQENVTFHTHSLSLRDLKDDSVLQELLADQTSFAGRFSVASSVYTGANLLAYIKGTSLHAKSYDGTIDVVLESGVSKFFFLPYMELAYLR